MWDDDYIDTDGRLASGGWSESRGDGPWHSGEPVESCPIARPLKPFQRGA